MSWAVVFRIRQYLKGSLWVLPMLGGALGVLLAGLDDRLERAVAVPPSWQYSTSTATSALTSIVAATVALLGFVVTISVLVVQRVLAWEASLIDPVGGILGALVFHAVVADHRAGSGAEIGQFAASIGVGLAGGVVGVALLWLLLRRMSLGEVLGTEAMLAVVIAVAAVCDMVRDDTGLIAAIVMGLGLANLPGFDLPARRPFFETVVQLIIGVLFISISATVTPDSLRGLLLPSLGLVAVLVLVVRPLVALASTLRTDLSRAERGFIGWMDPRGIVAASTASTFSATLVAGGVAGADKILPVTFLVIVMTVLVYGLSAAPAARFLGAVRPARTRPLLVGGGWVVDLGLALRKAGLDVLMWAGVQEDRDRIARAGLELAPGELLAAATARGGEMEGVTAVLLLTAEHDFNALASTTLEGNLDGVVYRAAAPGDRHGVVAPYTGSKALFGGALTGSAVGRRHQDGAEIVVRPAADAVPDGYDLLFVVRADGRLVPVTDHDRAAPEDGDTLVLLGPARGDRHRATDPVRDASAP